MHRLITSQEHAGLQLIFIIKCHNRHFAIDFLASGGKIARIKGIGKFYHDTGVGHRRYLGFQLEEVAIARNLFVEILHLTDVLRSKAALS